MRCGQLPGLGQHGDAPGGMNDPSPRLGIACTFGGAVVPVSQRRQVTEADCHSPHPSYVVALTLAISQAPVLAPVMGHAAYWCSRISSVSGVPLERRPCGPAALL